MNNLIPYRIFESIASQKVTAIINNSVSKHYFLQILNKICLVLDIPLSEIDDSVLKYLPSTKAEKLYSEKDGVTWIKFWFDSSNRLIKTTCTSNELRQETISNDLNDYKVTKTIGIGDYVGWKNGENKKIEGEKDLAEYLLTLPQYQMVAVSLDVVTSEGGKAETVVGSLYFHRGDIFIIHNSINYNGMQPPASSFDDWKSKGEYSWILYNGGHLYVNLEDSISLLERKKIELVPIENILWANRNQESFHENDTIEERFQKTFRSHIDKDTKNKSDYCLALDFEKLAQKAASMKKKSEIKSSRTTYEIPIDDESLKIRNVHRRMQIIKDRIKLTPETDVIKNLIEMVAGGKYLFFYMFMTRTRMALRNYISTLDYTFNSDSNYFYNIESIYKKVGLYENLSKNETELIDQFFMDNTGALNKVLNSAKGDREFRYEWDQLIKKELYIISKSKKTRIDDLDFEEVKIKSPNFGYYRSTKSREAKFGSFYEDMMKISKLVYDKLSPLNYDIYPKNKGGEGLLYNWYDKYLQVYKIFEDEKMLGLKKIIGIVILQGHYQNWIEYDEDFGYEYQFPIDDFPLKKIPEVFTHIKNELDKIK